MILDLVDHILAISVRSLASNGDLWAPPQPKNITDANCNGLAVGLLPILSVLPSSSIPVAAKTALREMPWVTLDTASKLGDIWLLNHLLYRGECGPLTPRFRHAVDLASENGHVHVLRWLFSKRSQLLLGWTEDAMDKASANGHVVVLEWWLVESGIAPVHLKFSCQAVDLASANGHLDVLTWWVTHFFPNMQQSGRQQPLLKYTDAAMNLAARNGHLRVLEWWVQCAADAHRLALKCRHILDHAAQGGQIGVLDWCMRHLQPLALRDPLFDIHKQSPLLLAIEHDQNAVLLWWDANTGSFSTPPSWHGTPHLARAATARGNLVALKWLHQKGWYVGDQSDLFLAAVISGDLETVKWVHSHVPSSPPATQQPSRNRSGGGSRWTTASSTSRWTSSVTASNEPYYLATKHGHVHLLPWLALHSGHQPQPKTNYKTIASAHGLLDVLEWWWAYDEGSRRLEPMALIRATDAGHVHILQWWKKTGLLKPGVPLGQGLLDTACAAGHVDAIEWWMSQSGLAIEYDKHTMDDASASGQVGVLSWWVQSGCRLKYSHEAMDSACAAGHLHVVRWWIEHADAGRVELKYTQRAVTGLAMARPDVAALVCQRWGLWTMGIASLTHWGDLQFIDVWRRPLGVSVEMHALAMDWHSAEGDVATLEHIVRNHDIKSLVYTQAAMGRATVAGHVHVLEWWRRCWQSGKIPKVHVPLEVLSLCKSTQVEQWWLDSGLL